MRYFITLSYDGTRFHGWQVQPNGISVQGELQRALSLLLRQPIYLETAAYGHMGRRYEKKVKRFTSHYHPTKDIEVELFTWEKLDMVEELRRKFGLTD